MNFLSLRSNQTAASEQQSDQENVQSRSSTTLEKLVDEDPFPPTPSHNAAREWSAQFGSSGAAFTGNDNLSSDSHIDVPKEQGWITIPYKELPGNWIESASILSFCSLDRCFVFPGEQVHILACLSANNQDSDSITPFKVASVISENGAGRSPKKENRITPLESDHVSSRVEVSSDGHDDDQNGNDSTYRKVDPERDVSHGVALPRLEDHNRQTETLLENFRNSHFFVRIADSKELLWSRRRASGASAESSSSIDSSNRAVIRKSQKTTPLSAAVDSGGFDTNGSGGMARNGAKCCALPNGDIVVSLQVNVGVDLLQDPILEILQFVKYQEQSLSPEKKQKKLEPVNEDPCGDLLKWLLPLDNSIPPPSRSLSPPPPSLSSGSNIRTTSSKPNLSGSSSSQIFSFGNFRSYSMSSLPPNATPPNIVAPNSKENFDTEDWNHFSYTKLGKHEKTGNEGLLSFRGVSLEPDRFSVSCGLEGIYIPGKRWRRKIEIIQPVAIHSFSAECNTEDLLCVQIKNVSPAHTPDIVVYLDTIMIIFEKASEGGPPLSVPIACTEAGNEHSLPNLALRRGEEHSFILKPATSMWKTPKVTGDRNSQPSPLRAGSVSSFQHPISVDQTASCKDHYAILLSCRCNYTESKLFFKQPTSWRPHVSRDVLISVASEMSKQTLVSNGRVPQLPVQVLTLQASNLTSEDLTMTVLAPASFMSPPSVLSLNSSPTSPTSPYVGSPESTARVQVSSSLPIELENRTAAVEGAPRSVIPNEQLFAISDVLPKGDLGCTHLWLQSRVPLGCVPARSTATIKLELLPLTDGIITLDSLQIDIKEKGYTCIPEYSLKINATSSIATGIKQH